MGPCPHSVHYTLSPGTKILPPIGRGIGGAEGTITPTKKDIGVGGRGGCPPSPKNWLDNHDPCLVAITTMKPQ